MFKFLTTVVFLFALSGCNLDVEPTIPANSNYEAVSMDVFIGTIDGVETDIPYPKYTCNEADLFTYLVADNSAVLNTDSTQVTCLTTLITRVEVDENNRPLYN